MPKLICFGDSITDCGRLWDASPLGNGYVSMLEKKLNQDTSEPWSILNRGFDGFTVSNVLETAQRFPRNETGGDIWVSLLVGVNDIYQMLYTGRSGEQTEKMMRSFCETYDRLLTLLKSFLSGKGCLLVMEPFVFPLPESNLLWLPLLSQMSEGIRQLADRHDALWIPLQEDLLRLAKTRGFENITSDGIHLTGEGHQELARKIFDLCGH